MAQKLVCNPPWVTKIIGDAYEELRSLVPPAWMPQIDNVRGAGDHIVGDLSEYGCGAYGCVYPTMDENVVLKVTTDDTEAEFAGSFANSLQPMICVIYHQALKLPVKHRHKPGEDERDVYLLWRESADHVGGLANYIDDDDERGTKIGDRAAFLIDAQHEAARHAFRAVRLRESDAQMKTTIQAWLGACKRMGSDPMLPELRPLAMGLIDNYHEQRVLFGDVHMGNIGRVQRGDAYHWVITDPGHIAVVYFDR